MTKGNIHERFIGYVHASKLDATSLGQYILTTLSSMHLDINNCIGQCYDGASVMSGQCVGVSAKIKERTEHALYVHCCAHRLNLVDTTKQI